MNWNGLKINFFLFFQVNKYPNCLGLTNTVLKRLCWIKSIRSALLNYSGRPDPSRIKGIPLMQWFKKVNCVKTKANILTTYFHVSYYQNHFLRKINSFVKKKNYSRSSIRVASRKYLISGSKHSRLISFCFHCHFNHS